MTSSEGSGPVVGPAPAWHESGGGARALLRDVARQRLFPLVEWVWAAAFGLIGQLRPLDGRVRPWATDGTERVVIVAPHPDDETVGAGGVAVLHRRAGDSVVIGVVSDGSASRAGGLGPEEMRRRRRHEVEAAAEVLGASDLVCLGLPENRWRRRDAAAALAPLLRGADVVYAPSSVDYHPEHLRVAEVVAGLVRPGQKVRAYQVGVPLTARLANLVADIGEVEQVKRAALRCMASQADALAPIERMSRYLARRHRKRAVEVFWEMPGDVYARVGKATGRRRRGGFRGIRQAPVTDPLGWLVGGRARAELRALADGEAGARRVVATS